MLNSDTSNVIELNTPFELDISPKQATKDELSFTNTDTEYNTFFKHYLYGNIPCVVRGTVTKNWKSANEWIKNNKPDFSYINERFGNVTVPVANCDEKYYNVQKKTSIQLSEFISYWQDYIKKSYTDMPCLYMKDWHFTQDFPEENIYRVPKYFASDWLNEYYSAKKSIRDDYKFVYMGPKGSWTPLHADVFTSYSWSVNVCGRKRWLLFPPGEEECLRNRHGHLVYDAGAPELEDEKLYPRYKELRVSIEVIQEAGEAIFVPSGWHHQVWNLEDTISINHNWVNGCNIETMWSSLQSNLMAVKKEVEDCKDMEGWDEHCQLMLQAMFDTDTAEDKLRFASEGPGSASEANTAPNTAEETLTSFLLCICCSSHHFLS
ncbi:2-oxoglutarate and iron-dependent oxygenase JMJD4 isoform X2 [Periplaneta americana]|uniref:2-oxoglutarate and iron-dependent oxygenase JMJD4 isoform X2 n=1 Tax=Periplaneta americana TaxID=6978 RepID=UPI0037E8A4A3